MARAMREARLALVGLHCDSLHLLLALLAGAGDGSRVPRAARGVTKPGLQERAT